MALHQPGLLGIAQVKTLRPPAGQQWLAALIGGARARGHDGQMRGLGHLVVARDGGAQIRDTARTAQIGHLRRCGQ
jgi:hypothetical protein